MTGTYFSVRCKNFVEEVISVRLQVGEHIGGLEVDVRLQVGEHIGGLEVDGDTRVESSICGFVEFFCVVIGWLEFVTCCREECPALSMFRLLCLRVDRGEPGWSTWRPWLFGVALVGETVVLFVELCDTCPRRLVGLRNVGDK
jgi:hypothetical protein